VALTGRTPPTCNFILLSPIKKKRKITELILLQCIQLAVNHYKLFETGYHYNLEVRFRVNKKSDLFRFWDETVVQAGHTGYQDVLLHHYDQPLRLATVQRIFRKLFPQGLHERTVLDIGCGTGDFIALALRHGAASVDGVDISSQVIAKARARFKADASVRLRQGCIIEQVTEQNRYDLITSITVLQHHVEEDELIRVLGILRSALKPNGLMIVLELAPPIKKLSDNMIAGYCTWWNGHRMAGTRLFLQQV